MTTSTDSEALCRSCGMCCDGTLFTNVALNPGEVAPMRAVGMQVFDRGRGPRFAQPCIQFANSCCSIYADRPASCQRYQCRVLRRLVSSDITIAESQAMVRKATTLADRLCQLLADAGHHSGSVWERTTEFLKGQETRLTGAELSRRHPLIGMHIMFLRRVLAAEFRVPPRTVDEIETPTQS